MVIILAGKLLSNYTVDLKQHHKSMIITETHPPHQIGHLHQKENIHCLVNHLALQEDTPLPPLGDGPVPLIPIKEDHLIKTVTLEDILGIIVVDIIKDVQDHPLKDMAILQTQGNYIDNSLYC